MAWKGSAPWGSTTPSGQSDRVPRQARTDLLLPAVRPTSKPEGGRIAPKGREAR